MKLPTLNIDVAINTGNLKKQIANANKSLGDIGGRSARALGGGAGKLATLGGGMGTPLGQFAIGGALIAAEIAAPFKVSAMILDSMATSADEARKSLTDLANGKNTYGQTGVGGGLGARLAARSTDLTGSGAGKGFMDAFWGGAANEFGQTGGIIGDILDGAESVALTGKGLMAALGAFFGNKEGHEIARSYDMGSSSTVAQQQSYMTQQELNQMGKTMDALAKQQRAANT
jgi:hypothetical protein